ncbi:hypothetical protein [Streptomyces sp. NPDC047972]
MTEKTSRVRINRDGKRTTPKPTPAPTSEQPVSRVRINPRST